MKFSYQQIEGCCNDMHRVANRMKEILDEVNASVSKLEKSGAWEGKGANYYTRKMKKLISNFDDVYQEMEMAVLFLADVSEGYQAIEEKIMGEICSNLKISEPNYQSSKIFGGV